jgi:heme exporter protein A
MLQAQTLTCRRGGQSVFRDITFTLPPGSVLQVTGANGSGKSSLLRVLAGLLDIVKGDILWQQENIADDPVAHRQRLHYIGHLDALKNELTAAEMLRYWQALRGASATSASDPFEISAFADKPVRHLSAGQKRRLTLSRLAPDDAPLWLLDEPATALDAKSQQQLAALIAQHRAKGGIAVIATHHDLGLPDAQSLEMAG